jgi:hypothetical protein
MVILPFASDVAVGRFIRKFHPTLEKMTREEGTRLAGNNSTRLLPGSAWSLIPGGKEHEGKERRIIHHTQLFPLSLVAKRLPKSPNFSSSDMIPGNVADPSTACQPTTIHAS